MVQGDLRRSKISSSRSMNGSDLKPLEPITNDTPIKWTSPDVTTKKGSITNDYLGAEGGVGGNWG